MKREQAPRLRRQFIERASEHFRRELVRQRDVIERHFDKFDRTAVDDVRAALLPLVLVQQARWRQ